MRRFRIAWLILVAMPWAVTAATVPPPTAHSSAPTTQDDGAAWRNWLQCPDGNCDRALLARFQKQHAQNAAVWMPDVDEALQAKDAKALDAALRKMAAGTRFDDGVYARARASALANIAKGMTADNVLFAFKVAMNMRPLSGITLLRACKALPASDDEGHQACVRIGRLMRASHALHDRTGGDQLILDFAAAARERSLAQADWNQAWWQSGQLDRVQHAPDCDHALARLTLDAVRRSATQEDMAAYILRARGIALAPPAGGSDDWMVPRPPPPPGAYTCGR